MRRAPFLALPLAALLVTAPDLVPGHAAFAQRPRPQAQAQTHVPSQAAQSSQPPHAWLFGTWTGGLFPVPSGISPEACLSQPVVIFTRDNVLRATLTSELYVQRVVESARAGAGSVEFRFTRSGSMGTPDPFGVASGGGQGFGCESPDVLHVERHTENEIAFPRCIDFPYPLLRCPSR
jgi:stalled ribosome alternative rescue factor ArfA